MSNYTSGFNETCHLSPHARAVSTLISAAAGSVIVGITSGIEISLFTTFTCWFTALRIVMTGTWFVYEAFQLHRVEGGDQFCDFYQEIPYFRHLVPRDPIPQVSRKDRFDNSFDTTDTGVNVFGYIGWHSFDTTDKGVNVFGWIGWLWVTIYLPVLNTMWLVGNWSDASGTLKFARAMSVGVSALPLTMDTKAPYGDVLEKYLGKPFRWLFTIISAVACLYLGLLTVLLLCLALADLDGAAWLRAFLYVLAVIMYTFYSFLFTFFSFILKTPNDEGYRVRNLRDFLGGLAMGVFGMFFVAASAWSAMQESPKSPGIGLKEFTACRSVALWRKVIQLLP